MHVLRVLLRNSPIRSHKNGVTHLSTPSAAQRKVAAIAKEDNSLIQNRLRRVCNNTPRLDASGTRVEFDLPGFPLSDFARTGTLGVWNLLKNLEIIRQQFEKGETERVIDDSEKNVISVVASQKLEVFPGLYEKAALVRPMHVIQRPGHVGTTSLSVFVELKDAETGELYVSNQRQIVSIDVLHRKTAPLRKSFAKFRDFADPTAEPVIIPDLKPTADALTYTFKVQHTDTDQLYHTNQSVYIRLCANAAANACNDGKLKNFSGDFLRYEVSGALIRYLGESFPGDHLEVTLWEDQDDLDSLYFHISRSNKLIHTAKLTYYKTDM